MTFVHPWILLGVPLVAAWTWLEWGKGERHLALLLKAASFCLVILALSQPEITLLEHRVAVALLADASGSVPAEDIRRELDLVSRLRAEAGRNTLDVIPFAGRILNSTIEEIAARPTIRPESRQTNLEVAIRDALSRLPESRVPRICLASDGRENQGSVERALYQARTLGVPIDTFELRGSLRPPLQLESISLPSFVFTGERFPIEVSVASPERTSGRISILAEGKEIGGAAINLTAGKNMLRIHTQLDAVGATQLSGVVNAGKLGEVRFDRVLSLRRPRLLMVTQEPNTSTRHLRQVLEAARFEVVVSPGPLPARLEDFQVVLAVNHDLESWSGDQKRTLEKWVRQGGGFAMLAGENNVYEEHKGDDDPVQKLLPAHLAPPRMPEGNAVVLIIDKSSSMAGRKIELARRSAIGVIENLRPYDQAGVLVLDNTYQWAVNIHKVDDPATTTRLIGGIIADGGTNIAPALREAFRQIRKVDAVYKHIVLLTDGISEEGDSMALAKEAMANQVTVSTIGLGEDVNRSYLEKVAALAKGKSYLLSDIQSLEQLMLRDVEEHTGLSTVERTSKVSVLREVGILEGTGMQQAPPLLGYSRFIARPQAETILQVDRKHPLLVRWQYGLGRSAVFASDAKSRWASKWLQWSGYGRFWTNLIHDLLPRAQETETRAEFDRANRQIVVQYSLPSDALRLQLPEFYVFGPDGFRKAVTAGRITETSFRVQVPIEAGQGLFRIRPAAESASFPEVGIYLEEAEFVRQGANPELLQHIARTTGGRFNPAPHQVFDAGDRSIPASLNLWPLLLVLALMLNLIELAERKGYRLPRRFPALSLLRRAS